MQDSKDKSNFVLPHILLFRAKRIYYNPVSDRKKVTCSLGRERSLEWTEQKIVVVLAKTQKVVKLLTLENEK